MLFLGSFLKIIVNCKANNTTQKQIVELIMKSIDSGYSDSVNNGISTNLAGGIKNPSNYAMEYISHMGEKEYDAIVKYFEKNIIALIKENDKQTVIKAIYLLIQSDNEIQQDTIVDVITGKNKKDFDYASCEYAKTLAGVFLYIIRNTNNNQKRGLADKIAKEYIKKAREIPDKVSCSQNNGKEYESENEVVELIRCFDGTLFSCAGVAGILGKWDEDKKRDVELIEKLAGKVYVDFCEELRIENNINIILKERISYVQNINSIRKQIIQEMDEAHLKMLLNCVSQELQKSSEFLGLSAECFEEFCIFLVSLRTNLYKAKRLGNNELHNCIFIFEKNIFSGQSEYAIQRLLEASDILIEADINAFLSVMSVQIFDNNYFCKLIRKEHNSKIIYPLADTLRKASLSEKYYPDTMIILKELSQYNSLFEVYMKCIMYPVYPQTNASINTQMGVIKKFHKQNESWTWNFVADLLPGNASDTYPRIEYLYLPYQYVEKSALEYDTIVKTFISFICDNTDRSLPQLIKLLNILPCVDYENASIIVNTITLEPENENAETLWKQLQRVTKWSSNRDDDFQLLVNRLRSHFLSGKEKYEKKELFSYNVTIKPDKNQKNKAIDYIIHLYKEEGLEGIISFAPSVEDTFLFSEIVLMIVPQNEVLEMIELLSDGNYNSFRLLLIEKLTSKEILSFVKNNLSKRLPILAEHFVDNKIITFVDQLMEVDQKYYWEKVSISGCHELNEKNFRKYINGLQTNGRYADSIHVLAYCLDKDNLDVDILINTLMQFAKPADYELSAKQSFGHDINEIIGFLQINASDRKDEIIKLEKKFIQELYPRGITYPDHYMNSFKELSDSKIDEIYVSFMRAGTETNHYSRDFSDEEKARRNALKKLYMFTGKTPEKEIDVISDINEYSGKSVAFCTYDGTFYLPTGEMSDEDILEIIDYVLKQEYAIRRINEDIESGKRTEWPHFEVVKKERVETLNNVILSEEEVLSSDWLKAYSKVCEDYFTYQKSICEEHGGSVEDYCITVNFIYLNDDDIPEMLLTHQYIYNDIENDFGARCVYLYTYKDGKAIHLKAELGEGIGYYAKWSPFRYVERKGMVLDDGHYTYAIQFDEAGNDNHNHISDNIIRMDYWDLDTLTCTHSDMNIKLEHAVYNEDNNETYNDALITYEYHLGVKEITRDEYTGVTDSLKGKKVNESEFNAACEVLWNGEEYKTVTGSDFDRIYSDYDYLNSLAKCYQKILNRN